MAQYYKEKKTVTGAKLGKKRLHVTIQHCTFIVSATQQIVLPVFTQPDNVARLDSFPHKLGRYLGDSLKSVQFVSHRFTSQIFV